MHEPGDDNGSAIAQEYDNVRQPDKSVTTARGRMLTGNKNLRSAQRLALMKQQSEQEKKSSSDRQQPHIQRLKDQVLLRQQLQQQQQGQYDALAYPISLDQKLSKRDKTLSATRPGVSSAMVSSSLRSSYGTTLPAHLSFHQGGTNSLIHHGVALSAPADAADFEGLNFDVTSPHSIGFSSAATSLSEYENVLNDTLESIAAMESEDTEIAPSLPNIVLDASSYADALNPPVGLTLSNSCPAIPMIPLQPAMRIPLQHQTSGKYRGGRKREEPPPRMSMEEREIYERERVKKDTHNDIEKRRREKINDHIQELATLLPSSYDLDLQNKKGTILQASVDYIKKLQRDRDKIKKMEDEQKILERRNRQLQLQMQTLQINMQKQQQAYKEQQQQQTDQQMLLQLQQQLALSQLSPSPVTQAQQQQHMVNQHQQQHLQQQNQLQQQLLQQQFQQVQQHNDQHVEIILTENMLAELTEGNALLQNDPLMFDLSSIQSSMSDAAEQKPNLDLMDIAQEYIIEEGAGGHVSELGIDTNDCFIDFLDN